jgi:hypothetical protein
VSKPAHGRVFITGAAGGLGTAFAKHYAGQGHPLFLLDLRERELEELVRALEPYAVDVRTLVANLATREGLETSMQAVRDCEDLEILVNNAGLMYGETHFDECTEVHIAQLDVNARAPLCLIWAAVPVLRARGHGFIVNVCSMAGLHPGNPSLNYSATKAYLVFLSKGLQAHVADFGIRVQALCPGLIESPDNSPQAKRVFGSFVWMTPGKVAAASYRALGRKRVVVKPAFSIHLSLLFWKLGLARYYYAVVLRWDRLLRKLNLMPPLPELPAKEGRPDTERE